ncbi:MAG: T9SS type A sorting domain-containing protein, partial [Bacteroidales bacterium]|nr:T9SS type A sorting domain-containing protein [Bacteroidales bacterium]
LLMSVAALFMGWSMVSAQEAYTKVTSASDLEENGVYLIVATEYNVALGMNFNNNAARETATVTIADGGVITTEVATASTDKKPYEIRLEKNGDDWALYDMVNEKYIARTSGDENKIQLQENSYAWTIKIDGEGNADIASKESTVRHILYMVGNSTTSARFSAYKAVNTTNKNIQLYKRGGAYVDETAPEIDYIVTNPTATTTMEVHFTEAVETASAETASNYTISNITISAAKMGDNSKTVILTTSAMTDGIVYELTVNGVKDLAGNAMEETKKKFTFGAIEVDDIAAIIALRDNFINAQQYRIKGEVVVVAHSGANIYVQDNNCENTKGHSLMLYDQPKTYADKFPAGTVLTNVAGSLTRYDGTSNPSTSPQALLEMQYLADNITENGTAEVVVSKATIADIKDNNLYHAALVQITDVEFDNIGTFDGKGGDGKGNYRMDDPSGDMNLHVYSTDNIVGEKVPTGKVSVTGYVGVYYCVSQLILRDKSDIVAGTSSANENGAAVKFSAYPNPTSGMLTLDVEDNNYNVRVFTVAGVEVMNLKALNGKTQINLEGMAKGIYVVEIATANGTSRAKVVLR